MQITSKGTCLYIHKGDYVFQANNNKVRCLDPLDRRINSYEEMQLLGNFTDVEMTMLRLRIGHIMSWTEEYKINYPY